MITMPLHMLVLALLARAAQATFSSEGACSPTTQQRIVQGMARCEERDTLVDLRQHMPNATNVIQVIPDFVNVKRCGGNCLSGMNHRCVPLEKRVRRVDVMMVTSQLPRSAATMECGAVEVEEHVGCSCGCPVDASHCPRDKTFFDAANCRCVCKNQTQRNECILRGMSWDPHTCMCVCPNTSWRVCSTGYIFDFTQTCQCVPTSYMASTGLLAAIFVLLTCMIVSLVGGYIMFKKQVGLFRPRSRRNTITPASAMAKALMSDQDTMDRVLAAYPVPSSKIVPLA